MCDTPGTIPRVCVWVRMNVLFQGKLNLFLFMNSKLIIYCGEKVELSVVQAQHFIILKIKARDDFLFYFVYEMH